MGEAGVGYRICPLRDTDQRKACVAMQREVWGFGNPDLVSASMLDTAGGRRATLLGAVSDSGGLWGFLFGFPAWWDGEVLEHSHLLAVAPRARNFGVGRELKLAQRRDAISRGLRTITWTFDPLEAKNAHLNINRLGVRVRHYYRDLYGASTTSHLHSSLGTDRFLAEWDLTTPLPAGADASASRGVAVVRVISDSRGLPEIEESEFVAEPLVEVALPAEIQELKEADLELARRWREVTRRALRHYFDSGYEIARLLVDRDNEGRLKTAYQLRQS